MNGLVRTELFQKQTQIWLNQQEELKFIDLLISDEIDGVN